MNSATTSASGSRGLVRSAAALAYAATCYLLFLSTFVAFIGFVGGMLPAMNHPSMASWQAALINLALVLGFGLQHSAMARPAFKRVWTRIVPEPAERATYVLAASLTLLALMVFWRPMPGVIWAVHGAAGTAILWGVFAFGWATVLYTTFLMDHFELFGLRQAWAYAIGRTLPDPTFKTPNVYRLVRHPMQLGFIIAFWAAPIMTIDRLAVAVLLTGYITIALYFEERDLVTIFGGEYRRYQERVPRLLPRFRSDL
jgi:protein-S-isoprenylcysteine O-methyltransferase Ste14